MYNVIRFSNLITSVVNIYQVKILYNSKILKCNSVLKYCTTVLYNSVDTYENLIFCLFNVYHALHNSYFN